MSILGIVAFAGAGWGVINVVDALDTDADCGSYGYGGYSGYGGYGCEPNRSDATIVVDPSVDLIDRQAVTLSGTNFDPNTQFGAVQCDAKLAGELQSSEGCDLSTVALGRTYADGTVTLTLHLRRIILVQGVEVDCAVEGACVVGAATIPDGFNPLESASAPISFDPSVPPVPRLEVDITVSEVTTRAVTGTVTCNREAQFYPDVLVRQTKGKEETLAYGYSPESATCDTVSTGWTATLFDSSGRLTGGPATYEVFGYAYDGFESASENLSGQTQLSGGPRPAIEPSETPGKTVNLSIVAASGHGAEQTIDLLVTCGRSVDEGYASVFVSQWAGNARVQGYGTVEFGPCDVATPVSVPLTSVSGVFAGGPAEVRASVYIEDLEPSGEHFFDSAAAVDVVKLKGASRPSASVQPNPGSRISVTSVTDSAISGTVACEVPVTVQLYGEAEQTQGRTTSAAFGFADDFACDGSEDFTLQLDDSLKNGDATVLVYASAYRVVDATPFPIREYLWSDYQAAAVRVRH